MKGQVIVGIHKESKEITPITEITQTGLACNCICYDCKTALEAVINTRRRKHFRHNNKKNCRPTPETELHLLAKRIILNNDKLYIPGKGFVTYTEPVCEVWSNELIPDATIIIDGIPFLIEIVVTNPISSAKFQKYKANDAKVMVIDLAEEDRELDHTSLENLILNDCPNKSLLKYISSSKKNGDNGNSLLLLGILAGIAIISRKCFSRKQSLRKRVKVF